MSKQKFLEGWKEVELKDICEVKKGSSITKDKVTNGDVPVIAGGQQPAYYHNLSNRTGATITVSGSGAYAGFVAYFNTPIFASDCSTIQSKSGEVVPKYVYYFLKGMQKKIYDLQRGIAQPHVYPKDLAKIKIPLPPLPTQKKIVSFLEKAEQLRQWRQESDKLTDDYLKSVFLKMFSNIYNSISVGTYMDKIIDYRGKTPPFSKEGIRCISAANVNNGILRFDVEKRVSIDYHKKNLRRGIIKPNDILITTEAPVGEAALLPDAEEFRLTRRVMGLRIDEDKANPYYILYFFLSNHFKYQLKKYLRGSTVPRILKPDLLNMQIPDAPIELQNKFAEIVKEINGMKERQNQSKNHIGDFFNVIMQKAFRGELVC